MVASANEAAQALPTRARIILASVEGEPVRPMAKRLGVSVNTVNEWRRRYPAEGCAGLRSGRPRRIKEAEDEFQGKEIGLGQGLPG